MLSNLCYSQHVLHPMKTLIIFLLACTNVAFDGRHFFLILLTIFIQLKTGIDL
ncbi:hypothetical protein ACJX0J_023730, partial [Zea mays]